jgi:hypothetical protein
MFLTLAVFAAIVYLVQRLLRMLPSGKSSEPCTLSDSFHFWKYSWETKDETQISSFLERYGKEWILKEDEEGRNSLFWAVKNDNMGLLRFFMLQAYDLSAAHALCEKCAEESVSQSLNVNEVLEVVIGVQALIKEEITCSLLPVLPLDLCLLIAEF